MDRPELRTIQDLILDFIKPYTETNVGSILISDIENLAKQLQDLLPDEERYKELKEELRVGNALTAKLTDRCRELEAQEEVIRKQGK